MELTTCCTQQLQLPGEGKSNGETTPPEEESLNNKPYGIQTRSGLMSQPPDRLIEAMTTELEHLEIKGEMFCYEALCPEVEYIGNLHPIMAYNASTDLDTMYMHQAMKQHDKDDFVNAMLKEIKDQQGIIWDVVNLKNVPKGSTILPAVWQIKRKQDIETQQVKRHKARLNIDGSRMVQGIHYYQNYAPVASWMSI